jgi:hypothetical protein
MSSTCPVLLRGRGISPSRESQELLFQNETRSGPSLLPEDPWKEGAGRRSSNARGYVLKAPYINKTSNDCIVLRLDGMAPPRGNEIARQS